MVKMSDINNVGKQKERQSWKGGALPQQSRTDIRIVPVGSIIAITYQSPRENHGESQMKQKKASFAGMLGSADADAQCWKGGEVNISDILLEHNE